MLNLARISKIVASVFGAALLLSQPVSSTVGPKVQNDTPTFTHVYDVFLSLKAEAGIPGPFGRRILHSFTGGNVTNATTGALVANVIPGLGGDLGLVSNVNGKLYTDLSLIVQWTDDQTLAFLKLDGMGSVVNNTALASSFTRMETNSTSRQDLANTFLLMTLDIPNALSSITFGNFKLFFQNNP
ncbi:hypothetical protein GYMLUDRAFT_921925 [Collybiopsis luxurians FD-317 M1]|uniref:Uncharacterized protein n=1 Tax=Collybiopsis luxurians FD-317 M1 TaxID=944289 RepID=A0A0D0AU58_9AGAR|nr:hypothetical protein GYMLUDRAFT_921925 [Collybiopsis luxurians FD-317 M1]